MEKEPAAPKKDGAPAEAKVEKKPEPAAPPAK